MKTTEWIARCTVQRDQVTGCGVEKEDRTRKYGSMRFSPILFFQAIQRFGVSTHPKLSQLWVTTNISLDDGIASRDLAFEVADYFKLSAKRARSIVGQVGNAVVRWDTEASALGIGKNDREEMASAFEHADLRKRQQNPVDRPPTTEMNSTPLHRLADLPLQTAGT
jgi:hypothetical protein